jgi:glycosyltransferase involved in cell wall biosynthesis
MRTLHITAFALRGGCEKNCYHFCAGASDDQHDIIVLSTSGPMSSAWKGLNVPVVHLDILKKNLMSFGQALKKYLTDQDKKYDLVILWSTIRLPLQLNALNKVAQNVRVYLGNPLMTGYSDQKDRFLSWIYPCTTSVILMACSSYVAKSHEKDGYFGRFPLKVSLNPVALPAAFPKKNFSSEEFNVGMVARLDPIKDHRTVLSAFKDIVQQIPWAKLHLVGDGILRKPLEDYVVSQNLTSSVTFHGDVEDVYRYLNEWNVFVYATTLQEGLGSVVAEAMANGLACVLSDLPMLHELAPDDNLVLWFKAGDAGGLSERVATLYNQPELRLQRGHSSFEYARQHFGIKRFIRDYTA